MRALSELGLAAIGGNCGNGVAEIEGVVHGLHAVRPDVPLVAKSNAGLPQIVDGVAVYSASPEVMAEYARRARALGATIIGACCGSTPAHSRRMAEALRSLPELDPAAIELASAPAQRQPAGASRRSREERRGRRE